MTSVLPVEEQEGGNSRDPKWLPLPLRFWFWVPFVVILALGAIGLEIALHFSKRNQGKHRVICCFLFLFYTPLSVQDGHQVVTLETQKALCTTHT